MLPLYNNMSTSEFRHVASGRVCRGLGGRGGGHGVDGSVPLHSTARKHAVKIIVRFYMLTERTRMNINNDEAGFVKAGINLERRAIDARVALSKFPWQHVNL